MFWFVVGVLLGFMLACFGVAFKIVGILRHTYDEDGVYFFMEVQNSNVGDILRQKYVVLKVDSKPTQK